MSPIILKMAEEIYTAIKNAHRLFIDGEHFHII